MAQHHSLSHKWKITYTNKDIIKINAKKKYRFKPLDSLKARLDESKSKLDLEYKKPKFNAYWSNCDPFKYEKQIVAKIGCTINVSNAWIKCFELIQSFNLVENIKTADKFIHFDNAAFPGSFIVATHHLVNTLYADHAYKYHWRGSCLLDANDQNTSPLEDKYRLYANYKANWLMSEHNNGDVLNEDNQLDFYKQLNGKVDLYTSDLGFDVSSDYNNQEKIQHQANIGQILSGLLTLKVGGCFITKQYTTMEPTTIAIMYATAAFFDEFYLCKPFTSRMANSETYLVGIGFKGNILQNSSKKEDSNKEDSKKEELTENTLNAENDKPQFHPYIMAMFDKITGRTPLDIPIFDAKSYPTKYINTIVKATEILTDHQISKLESDIKRCNDCIKGRFNGSIRDDPHISEFYDSIEPALTEWFSQNPILPITKKLDMIDALGQRS
jgi:hypothetical protein